MIALSASGSMVPIGVHDANQLGVVPEEPMK